MSAALVAWIRSALRAAEIVDRAERRRDGIAVASEALGVGEVMIRRQLDLLDYVRQHARLEDVRVAQTRLELFRSVERADPVRGSNLRAAVLADRLNLRQIQIELEEAKVRRGLREPVALTLAAALDICRRDVPGLDVLRPPVDERRPEGDGLWIGADADWTLTGPGEAGVPTWCMMVSINVACARDRKGNFVDFTHRVISAAVRYRVVSVVLASEQERRILTGTLAWVTGRVPTVFYLHVVDGEARTSRIGRRGNPLGAAIKATLHPMPTGVDAD